MLIAATLHHVVLGTLAVQIARQLLYQCVCCADAAGIVCLQMLSSKELLSLYICCAAGGVQFHVGVCSMSKLGRHSEINTIATAEHVCHKESNFMLCVQSVRVYLEQQHPIRDVHQSDNMKTTSASKLRDLQIGCKVSDVCCVLFFLLEQPITTLRSVQVKSHNLLFAYFSLTVEPSIARAIPCPTRQLDKPIL